MAIVLLILSPVDNSLGPVKLPNALHLALTPFAIVAFSIEPSVSPMPVEEICIEITLIVL